MTRKHYPAITLWGAQHSVNGEQETARQRQAQHVAASREFAVLRLKSNQTAMNHIILMRQAAAVSTGEHAEMESRTLASSASLHIQDTAGKTTSTAAKVQASAMAT